jgi:phosphatidylinositol 4-kinase
MIIHLEAEWDDNILERFSLIIAQQSLHFALQLNWILQGAIEDYQPELPDGSLNPNYNPLFFSRCIKLLTNIERCVVYKYVRSPELQRLYEKGKITKQEIEIMEQADRRFNALKITGENDEGEAFGGTLLYKRKVRTACYKAKGWKSRYFSIEERMLNCYSFKGGRLVRSMPLEGAVVEPVKSHPKKYKNMFSVINRTFEFEMRGQSQEEMNAWMKMLKEEANSSPVFGHMDDSVTTESAEKSRVVSEMTPAQRSRYEFFRDERDFIRRLTDIAEELRFKEPAERKILAPKMLKHLTIPPCVYSPLCNSTDTWLQVTGSLYQDTRVFNTNERCPVIMYLLAEREGVNVDVAQSMHRKFDKTDEATQTIKEEGEQKEQGEESADFWNDGTIEEETEQENGTGNIRLNRFLREGMHMIPRKIATRMEKNRRPSAFDKVTGLQSVSIVEGESLEDFSKLSSFSTSGIDSDSINRAKKVACGGESWAEKSARMLHEATDKAADREHQVVSVMSKSNDDLRQEVFIMQMIHYYKSVFAQAKLPLWLKTYRILSTSSSTGLIEVLVDATSIDGLKKNENYPKQGGLRKYFEVTYGGPESESFKEAQRNFMQSLAGYSVVSYLLGLKDRHNGNIMIDTHGRIMHIDFGFVMGMAPGHEFSMERAPFKLTKEYLEVMGGVDDPCYKEYQCLFVEGLKAARANSQIALGLVEIMMYKSKYPCFTGSRYGGGISLKRFEKRLMLSVSEKNVEERAKGLIRKACDHLGTNLYDKFQKWSNGYEP